MLKILLLVSLVGLSIQGFVPSYGKADELCTTSECVIAAATILEALDTTADPCVDFYQYACGGWVATNEIPSDSSRWSQFDVLRDELDAAMSSILTEPQSVDDPLPLNQVKDFYAACMDEPAIETVGLSPLTDFLDQYGGWPIASDSWNSDLFDWSFTVAESRRILGAEYVVGIFVYADIKDVFNTVTYVDQPTLGLSRTVLTNPQDYAELVTAYKQYINSSAILISGSTVPQATIDADVESIFAFEAQLASITTPAEDRRDTERMYNPMTVGELQTMTGPTIPWLTLLNLAFGSAGISFTVNDRVIVQEIQFITDLVTLLDSTDQRTLANYILWRQVRALGGDTNQAMRDVIFEYNMAAYGVTSQTARSDECAGQSNGYMGYAIGVRYVQDYFSQEAKDATSAMVEDLREAFKDLLTVNDWMDDETKPLAQEKADFISKFIGYPDFYEEQGGLEAYYSGLTGVVNSSHFDNVLTLSLYSSTDELDGLGLPTERDRFLTPPTIVNAFYAPEFNSITFPAGILQPPFYWQNTIQVLNYGGIGQVIGHEITHGFDDQGRQNDKYGNAIPWWTNATIEAFAERAQCVVDQYASYVVPEIGENLNGVTTQGENIADNGGLREAYLAYQKFLIRNNGSEASLPGLEAYTAEQLFFLSNANVWCTKSTDEYLQSQILTDPHSPGRFRVIGPMSNMVQFSEAFNCPADTPMNPGNKCIVW